MIAKALNKIQNSTSDEDARVITVEADEHEARESVQSFVGRGIILSRFLTSFLPALREIKEQGNSKATDTLPDPEQNAVGPRLSNRTRKPTVGCSCCTNDHNSGRPGKMTKR